MEVFLFDMSMVMESNQGGKPCLWVYVLAKGNFINL
jgi:hypothetical protein